jgi:hypothetical protein
MRHLKTILIVVASLVGTVLLGTAGCDEHHRDRVYVERERSPVIIERERSPVIIERQDNRRPEVRVEVDRH